jgi:small subunit ribosomal protein S17
MTQETRTKTGTVVSAKNDKTVVVEVTTYKTHPIYKKQYPQSKKFHAHDPENKFQEGDTVTIYECAPISKNKKWTVVKPEEKN